MTLTVGGRDFEGSAATTSSGNTGFSWPTNPAFTWAVGDTVSVSLKATPPDAPTNVSAEAGGGEVALSWDDPSDDTITKYQYRQKTGSGGFGNWTDIPGSGATTTSHTVTSLTPGTAYSFKVRAEVATLPGAASGTVTATPAAYIELWSPTLTVGKAPGGITTFGYRPKFNYGALSPSNFTYGGEQYTTLTLEQRYSNKLDYGFSPDIPFKSVLTLIVDGESFRASAAEAQIIDDGGGLTWVNSGLTWAVGDIVAVSLRAVLPGTPANFKAEAGDSEVALSWDDPSDDTITKYQYRQKEGSGGLGDWTDITGSEATTTSHTVISLTNGTAYSFQVRAAVATLPGVASGTGTATLSTNRAPAFATETATLDVEENTAEGDDVGGAVTATDEDNDTLTYSLSGTDAASFAISGSTGQITVGTGAGLDNETKASYAVTVTATDTSDATDTIEITIDVTDEDEQPSLSGSAAVSYAENCTASVANYTAADPEGATVSWILSGADSDDFSISAGGALSFNSSPDFETPADADTDNIYQMTVEATDGTTDKVTLAVTVTVTNVDEVGAVALSPAQPVVGTALTAILTDPDGSISGTAWVWAGSTDWDGSAGTGTWTDIIGAASANYTPVTGDAGKYLRATASYTDEHGAGKSAQKASANQLAPAPALLTVSYSAATYEATEGGDAVAITVNISPVADREVLLRIESQPRAGTTVDTDEFDVVGLAGSLTLTIDRGDAARSFTVQANHDDDGVHDQIDLGFGGPLPTQVTVGERSSAVLTVNDDEGGTVTLSPAQPEVSVAISATLADPSGSITGTTWVWSRSGDGLADWSDITEATSVSYTPVAAEVGNYLRATATYTDAQGSGQKAWKVSANSVGSTAPSNNPPAFASDSDARPIAENSEANTNVGSAVTATDPDSGDALTYTLSGTDAASFAIGASNGQITVGSGTSLDYESGTNSYSVIVSVSDGKNSEGNADTTVDDTITVAINVTDVEEAGTVVLSPAQPVVGTALTATLTDPDGSIAATTWVWASSSDWDVSVGTGTWTTISGATSTDTTSAYTPVDADLNNYLRATASYTDPEGSGKSAQAVSANAVQPAPVVNTAPAFPAATAARSIAENTTAGANVGDPVTATDTDTLTYSLSGTNATSFTIGTSSGQITVGTGTTLDFESRNSYEVVVTATDTITVTINVTDVDEAGVVSLSPSQPQVGTELTATLTDPDGTLSGGTWQWASSADATDGSWTDIEGATSASYTPVRADLGNYLQAMATYTDGHGAGKSATAQSVNSVQATPVSWISFGSAIYSGIEGGPEVTITVNIVPPADRNFAVPILFANGATESDYYTVDGVDSNGNLRVSAGDRARTVTITPQPDSDVADETLPCDSERRYPAECPEVRLTRRR